MEETRRVYSHIIITHLPYGYGGDGGTLLPADGIAQCHQLPKSLRSVADPVAPGRVATPADSGCHAAGASVLFHLRLPILYPPSWWHCVLVPLTRNFNHGRPPACSLRSKRVSCSLLLRYVFLLGARQSAELSHPRLRIESHKSKHSEKLS